MPVNFDPEPIKKKQASGFTKRPQEEEGKGLGFFRTTAPEEVKPEEPLAVIKDEEDFEFVQAPPKKIKPQHKPKSEVAPKLEPPVVEEEEK